MAKTRLMKCKGDCGAVTEHAKSSYSQMTDSTGGKLVGAVNDRNPAFKVFAGGAYQCVRCGYVRSEKLD